MNLLYLIILLILQNRITLQNPEETDSGQCTVENKNVCRIKVTQEPIKNPEETDSGQCTVENKNECQGTDTQEHIKKYNEEYNSIFNNIENAKMNYIPCATDVEDLKCECHAEVIRQDLVAFKEKGISRQMLKDAAQYGTRYKIYQHKLYRETNCMFPSRCEGIEYFILKLLPTLPDMDFIVNTRDYPQVHSKFGTRLKPVFSFSKTAEYLDITYPAWTFWAGGPAISLHPTGIGRWDLQREKLRKASTSLPWHDKVSKAFFRGSRTSDERDSLVLLSRHKSTLVNAQYTKNQAWKSPKDTLNAEPAKEVSFEDHCRYKYLFNFRGVAASFRFKHLFLCKSLVFHVGDEWLEFFYPSMKPWIHYVPLKKYPSEKDIENILEFFQKHAKLAQEIAENGYDFIWHHLRMQDVECYWRKLLKSYAKLLKFKVEEDVNMILIKAKIRNY